MKLNNNHNMIVIVVLTIFSLGFLVAGFFVPPMGIIDGSVLKAVGELFGFATLWTVVFALRRGSDITIKHGQTEATINNDSDEQLNNIK